MCEAQERAAIVETALSWAGTPYHHQAKIKKVGCDCATLLVGVFQEAGLVGAIELPHYPPDFMMHRDEELYLSVVERFAKQIEPPPQPGDVVAWKMGRVFSHGAIVIAWPTVIHSVLGRNVFLTDAEKEELLSKRERRFFSFWAKK